MRSTITLLLVAIASLSVAQSSLFRILLLMQGPPVSGLTISPNHVFGGGVTQGIVTLSSPAPAGGVTVSLSANTSALTFPATVTVVEGASSAQFEIKSVQVNQSYRRVMSASYNGTSRTAYIFIDPGLKSLSLHPAEVTGGSPVQGTILLNGPAPADGAEIQVSDNSSAITTPTSAFIEPGNTLTYFSAGTSQVTADYLRLVHVSLGGLTRTAHLRLTAGPRLSGFSVISPSQSGNPGTGSVGLSGPAPTNGRLVQITDNSTAVTTPSELQVQSGATGTSFEFPTAHVATTQTRQITASQAGISITRNVILRP